MRPPTRRYNPHRHRTVLVSSLLVVLGCGAPASPPPAVGQEVNAEATTIPARPSQAPAPTSAVVAAFTPPNVPTLPADVRPGEFTRVRLPKYRAALVVHGAAHTRRALVYLHGICGDVERIRDWTSAAAEYVTTIALYGNKPCPTSSARFSWNQDIEFIHELVQVALAKVAQARGGLLDIERVALFGYSQGASRAERLVERHPEHYPWLILGGPPAPPRFEHLRRATKSVILVGSEEHQNELRDAAAELSSLGAPTRFDIFEGVGHGAFGPNAPAVMTNALDWLFQD
jgi:predicted esterase